MKVRDFLDAYGVAIGNELKILPFNSALSSTRFRWLASLESIFELHVQAVICVKFMTMFLQLSLVSIPKAPLKLTASILELIWIYCNVEYLLLIDFLLVELESLYQR